jgi:hypothetical protein
VHKEATENSESEGRRAMNAETAVPEKKETRPMDFEAPVVKAKKIAINHSGRLPAEFNREHAAAVDTFAKSKELSDRQVILRERIQQARAEHEQGTLLAKRHTDAGIPWPDGLDERLAKLEIRIVANERAFNEGARELHSLAKEIGVHERAAMKALTAPLAKRVVAHAQAVLEAVKGQDQEVLARFNHRTPQAAIEAFRAALELAELGTQLDPSSDLMGGFYRTVSPGLGAVVARAAGYRLGRLALRGA